MILRFTPPAVHAAALRELQTDVPSAISHCTAMKLSDIRQMRNRAPFRPFHIHLASGEVLPVQHPEQMSLPDDEKELFVVWTNSDWNLIEAEQVARISVARKSAK